jgi:hypothetical protein
MNAYISINGDVFYKADASSPGSTTSLLFFVFHCKTGVKESQHNLVLCLVRAYRLACWKHEIHNGSTKD